MAHQYPLYEYLLQEVNKRKDTGIDIKRICTTINNISQKLLPPQAKEHHEEIHALILHHDFITNGGLLSPIPYDGKLMVGGKGILHCLSNMPPILQQIIAQYLEIYAQ